MNTELDAVPVAEPVKCRPGPLMFSVAQRTNARRAPSSTLTPSLPVDTVRFSSRRDALLTLSTGPAGGWPMHTSSTRKLAGAAPSASCAVKRSNREVFRQAGI